MIAARSLYTPVFSIILLFFFSLLSAEPSPWPDYRLRGANIGIFPGWPDRYSEDDIANFALNWRANSIRILVNNIVPDSYPYQVDEATKADLFKLIDYCLKYRLYTVLAFSASFGNHDNFFNNEQLKAAYTDCWLEVATRYSQSEGVAYDLMNEPHDNLADTEWSGYAEELTEAIREIDSVSTIVIEPTGWGWPDGFDHLVPTGDPNTVYSFHFYGPMDYTHQRYGGSHMSTPESVWLQRAYPGNIVSEWGQEYWDKEVMRTYIKKAVAFRDKYDVRLWCGEFGCARWAIGADQWFEDWIDLLEEENIDWSYYAYREWHHMDIEMDPAERVSATERTETELVKQFKGYFAWNEVPLDFNRDGQTGFADAVSLLMFQFENPGSLAADFNRDGKSNIIDAISLLIEAKNSID